MGHEGASKYGDWAYHGGGRLAVVDSETPSLQRVPRRLTTRTPKHLSLPGHLARHINAPCVSSTQESITYTPGLTSFRFLSS